MKLYHYTTLNSFCKIWASKCIRFSDSQKTNDLFEQRKGLPIIETLYSQKRFKSIIEAAKAFETLYRQELSLYKQISFVMDYRDEEENLIYEGWQSSMMWGQYAHNQNGVCIEIDLDIIPKDSLRLESPIDYREEIPLLPQEDSIMCTKSAIKEYVQKNIDTIFFVKHKFWENENEYRMIKRGEGEMFLSIKDAISNIYVYSVTDISAEIVNNIISPDINLYALWIENKEDHKFIDKIDYRRYKKIMSGEIKPSKGPQASLKNRIYP